MSRFWSPAIQSLVPYTPGEQPKVTDLTKLNTNENPYPPAPGVEKILHRFPTDRLRLYPDPDASRLKQALADQFNCATDQVFVGNGSDEVLALAFMAFFRHPLPLLMPETTYSFYHVYAGLFGIDYQCMPLTDDFRIRLQDYPTDNGGIIFANPNAPTGVALPLEEIRALLERNRNSVVLVDEAYVDFGGESASTLIAQYPNLLVVQTFSKSRSLAGLRIGYALGDPALIEGLERVKNSFNSYPLDMVAIDAACASLADQDYFTDTCARIVNTREHTRGALQQLGFQVLPSSTNFLFARHQQIPAAELMAFLRERNILVRHFSQPRISNHLRITIGTDVEMDRLLRALHEHPGIGDVN